MESSYVVQDDENKTQEDAIVNDDPSLISLCNERNESTETSRPIMAEDGRGGEGHQDTSLPESMHLTNVNDYENLLEDKREITNVHVNVIHLLATDEISQVERSVASNLAGVNKGTCLNEKDLSLGLGMDSSSDHVTCTSQLIQRCDEEKQIDNSNTAVLVNEINESETPYLVTLNNGSTEIQSSQKNSAKAKKPASQKRAAKPKSRPAKIKKTSHLLTEPLNQNTAFLSGATMILDQQGNAITEIQPVSQIGGLYTVQMSQTDQNLTSAIHAQSVTSVQPSLTFETIPASTTSLQSVAVAAASKNDSVNQQWFTTKDDKSSLQVKGMKWKQGMWSKDEVALLKKNIDEYCKIRKIEEPSTLIFSTPKDERKHFYRSIAQGISRPLFAIYRKTLRLYDQKNYIGKYSDEEVVKLEELLEKYGHDWATIGHYLGRSAASVKDRCRLLRKNKKTGRWTEEEENILSECVREQTNTKEGESVTSGVTWSAIAERLGTRTEKQCRSKWLNYLNWKEANGKEWTKNDEVELIERISSVNVEDDAELDWKELAVQWPSARSPQWLRGKWWAMKKHVPDYKNLNYRGIMEYLQTTYLDALRVKIDRQTVALASTFSVNPTSLPLHTADHLSNHVAVGPLNSSESSSVVTDTSVLGNTHSHALINTSTIDLTPLQGYQLQFQLASLSPHQLLIPVNSTGIASNIGDHFVIPLNMTPAIITSSADQQQTQTGYIVHNVTDNQAVVSNSRHVELTQALVQTDLSIPIPAGEISQENLTTANIQAMNAGMVVSLEEPSLASPAVAQTSPPHHDAFDETMNLIQDERNDNVPNEIIVTSEQCRVDTLVPFVNDNSSVKVVKVDPIVTHDLDSPL